MRRPVRHNVPKRSRSHILVFVKIQGDFAARKEECNELSTMKLLSKNMV